MIINIELDGEELEKLVALLEESADCCEDMAAQYEDDDDYEEEMNSHLTEAANCRRLIGYIDTCIRHACERTLPGFSNN
jgi:hypothetical protein